VKPEEADRSQIAVELSFYLWSRSSEKPSLLGGRDRAEERDVTYLEWLPLFGHQVWRERTGNAFQTHAGGAWPTR
jgi:hypothetical protein